MDDFIAPPRTEDNPPKVKYRKSDKQLLKERLRDLARAEYLALHPKRVHLTEAERAEKQREKWRRKACRYRAAHPEKEKAKKKRYYERYPEKKREISKQHKKRYAAAHREKVRERHAKWVEAHPEYQQTYRARIRAKDTAAGHYVYLLKHPVSEVAFWVGCSKSRARLSEHLRDAMGTSTRTRG